MAPARGIPFPFKKKSNGSFADSKKFLDDIVKSNIKTPMQFIVFVKNAPRLIPANYHPADTTVALSRTDEFILRVAFELQVGIIKPDDFINRPAALYELKNSDGHHLRRFILKSKIKTSESSYLFKYFQCIQHCIYL